MQNQFTGPDQKHIAAKHFPKSACIHVILDMFKNESLNGSSGSSQLAHPLIDSVFRIVFPAALRP